MEEWGNLRTQRQGNPKPSIATKDTQKQAHRGADEGHKRGVMHVRI